jgi:Asp/Glu/hydantoin racemase
MRRRLINPNISASVSALIEAEARRSASAGTQITVLTAPFGVAYSVQEDHQGLPTPLAALLDGLKQPPSS